VTQRVHNFNPGPAALPLAVLEQARSEWFDWQGTGMSVMEVSHRSESFMHLVERTQQQVRQLLSIPDHYRVLWLSGGARAQYAMVPANLAQDKTMAFLETGYWSQMARREASKFGAVHTLASNARYPGSIPSAVDYDWPSVPCAYVHTVDNETVQGVEYPETIDVGGALVVSDMTSNIMSRPIDIERYGLIYASVQKNLGPAGLTLVIVRDDLVGRASAKCPAFMNYQSYVDHQSLFNTPATWTWYMVSLMLDWIEAEGGVTRMHELGLQKSKKLYDYIDASDFYHNTIDASARSRMNVVFNLSTPELVPKFLAVAKQHHLVGLKGHSVVGGLRASLYNSISMASVDALLAMMEDFYQNHRE
jgi:phosphoserine aminotransferase